MSQPYCIWDPNAGCVCDAHPQGSPSGNRSCNPRGSNQDSDCCTYDEDACNDASKNTKANWNYCDPMAGAKKMVNKNSTQNIPKYLQGVI